MICNRFSRPIHRLTSTVCFTVAVALLSLISAVSARAQAASGTGTIQGRVMNAQDGKYLPRAKVTIEAMSLETFTNDFGEYQFRDVPAGQVTVKADFTGQKSALGVVSVVPGQAATRDLRFNDEKGVNEDGAVVLDQFLVATNRYKNAQELAINEERYSTNIKNVVSTDAFGDIPNANVGEFVKFMPGVLVSYGGVAGANQGYSDSDASGVSVRGFGPEDTAILINGMPVSSSIPGSLTRQVGLDMLSINNASRVELIKVPTPDMPSNSIGGQINLITKSAFEYAKPSITYRVFFNINTLNQNLFKTVGPTNKKTFKTQPGLEFNVLYPVSPKFGFTLGGFDSTEFGQTYRAAPTYTYTGTLKNAAGETVSLSNPYLSRLQITDIPKLTTRRSGNIKIDWKPTPSQRLSANVQYSTYNEQEAQRRVDLRVANPSDWGPRFTTMTALNTSAADNMTVTTLDRKGSTRQMQAQYNLNWGGWKVLIAGSEAISSGAYVDQQNGHFSEVGMTLQPGLVNFQDIDNGVPRNVTMLTRAGAPVDYTDLANWRVDGTTAKSGTSYNKDTTGLLRMDIERQLDFIPFLARHNFALKAGARRDRIKKQKWGIGTGYREVLRSGATFSPADILDTAYLGQSPGYGLPRQQWASSYRLWEIEQKNDIFIPPTDGPDAVNNWNSFVNQQKSIKETADGAYIMLSGEFFRNRLRFVGGSRVERKKRIGRGPFTDSRWNYIKNRNGTVYTDAANPTGVRIDQAASPVFAQTPAGAALRDTLTSNGIAVPNHVYSSDTLSSLESRMLQLLPNRPVNQSITGDPSHSLSLSYDLTKKIVVKAAWSRTFGLPNLEDGNLGLLSGNNGFSINENIPIAANGTRGNITVANPGLKPSVSNNWDLEVSYYTDHGGRLSVSGYTKAVKNQIITFSSYSGTPTFEAVLPALGLDPNDYQDWVLNTSANSTSKQSTKGLELQGQQSFAFLGNWGKHLQGFATFTMKMLADAPVVQPIAISTPSGGTINYTPSLKTINLSSTRFATAGLQYSGKRFSVQLRGTFRNRNEDPSRRIALADGNYVRGFAPTETRIDINTSYRISPKYSAFLSVRDAFNGKRQTILKDDKGLLASYAYLSDERTFGSIITFGINGQF